ncbi:MAG: hypothetical protein GX539_05515 [Candidatus Cloacimonetes bacterium]|nr:hypothetical protein [Candidatus Cloacimonadota bacterium]
MAESQPEGESTIRDTAIPIRGQCRSVDVNDHVVATNSGRDVVEPGLVAVRAHSLHDL